MSWAQWIVAGLVVLGWIYLWITTNTNEFVPIATLLLFWWVLNSIEEQMKAMRGQLQKTLERLSQ